MKWISVEDRLPDGNQYILSYGKNHCGTPICLCIYEILDHWQGFSILQSGCGCCDEDHKNVTHWMPLPDSPDKNVASDNKKEPQNTAQPEKGRMD